MTPTEKHRETALELLLVVQRGFTISDLETTKDTGDLILNRYADAISAALAKAEREGREAERARCADIVERFAPGGDLYSEDFIDNDVATRVAIRGEILSEAGEGA